MRNKKNSTIIDSIIREYLIERRETPDITEPITNRNTFNHKTKQALLDMVEGLNEMFDDLEIIKEKEDDVVIDGIYVSEYLEDVLLEISSTINKLNKLFN